MGGINPWVACLSPCSLPGAKIKATPHRPKQNKQKYEQNKGVQTRTNRRQKIEGRMSKSKANTEHGNIQRLRLGCSLQSIKVELLSSPVELRGVLCSLPIGCLEDEWSGAGDRIGQSGRACERRRQRGGHEKTTNRTTEHRTEVHNNKGRNN